MNWQPSKCLEDPDVYQRRHISEETGEGKFVLIILNQPILISRRLFDNAWCNATYRFCADGGANRLYDLLETDEERTKYLPDYIRGDLDSLRDNVKAYYMSQGVPVERVDNEYSTDFMKCIELVRERDPTFTETTVTFSSAAANAAPAVTDPLHCSQEERRIRNLAVVAIGGMGGRFDQTMSSIHHLYIMYRERHATLVSDESIVVLLGPGTHEITCNLEIEGPTCGIIPVGSPETVITTNGLKWDVENWKTAFGTQLSTSNELASSKVTIHTNAPVVWTTEIKINK
ncbi:cAMP-dependent protein kinase subunit [Mortierella alpina]|nr:cAMP-dependent protein kinase subunit [Mortierella alpina]